MPEPTVPETEVSPTSSPINAEHPPCPPRSLNGTSVFVSLASAALCLAFFLPWVMILGLRLTGLDVTKTDTYWFVFIVPLLAGLTLAVNLTGRSVPSLRRLAGLSPFLILAYSLYHFGVDIFRGVLLGGWLSLLAGAVLVLLPSPTKPPIQG